MNQKKNLMMVTFCLLNLNAMAESSPPPSASGGAQGLLPGSVVAAAQPDVSGTAFSGNQSVSTVESKSGFKSLKERFALSYYGVYSGPSLGTQTDFTPTYDGVDGDVQNLDGVITAGYRLNKKWMVGVGVPLVYTPYLEDKGMTLNNLFLRVSDSELIKAGNFKMSLGSRFYLPTNEDSRKNGFVTGVRIEQNSMYDFSGAPITVGLFTYERQNFFNSLAESGTVLTLYAAPYLNYQFAKKVAGTLWVDLIQLKQKKGTSLSDMDNDPVAVQPGVNWDVNDNVSLNPYINVYPGNLTADSSSLGLILSAKVL